MPWLWWVMLKIIMVCDNDFDDDLWWWLNWRVMEKLLLNVERSFMKSDELMTTFTCRAYHCSYQQQRHWNNDNDDHDDINSDCDNDNDNDINNNIFIFVICSPLALMCWGSCGGLYPSLWQLRPLAPWTVPSLLHQGQWLKVIIIKGGATIRMYF